MKRIVLFVECSGFRQKRIEIEAWKHSEFPYSNSAKHDRCEIRHIFPISRQFEKVEIEVWKNSIKHIPKYFLREALYQGKKLKSKLGENP